MLILAAIPLIIFAFMKRLTWGRVAYISALVAYLTTFAVANGGSNQPTITNALLTTLLSGSLIFLLSVGLSRLFFRGKFERTRLPLR